MMLQHAALHVPMFKTVSSLSACKGGVEGLGRTSKPNSACVTVEARATAAAAASSFDAGFPQIWNSAIARWTLAFFCFFLFLSSSRSRGLHDIV